MNTERSQKDLADFPVSRQPRSRRAGAGAMSQRGGFAGSGHDLWRREPAGADADWEEGDEVTSDESPDAYRWGPYPFSTYSLDNEFPAATRHLARKECAREFRRYYETLQVPNVHLGCSLMSFGFMLRLLKPVLFPGVNTPVEEGWEYISDGCRVTHILENAVPWVVTVFLLRFGFRAHPGTGRLLSPPHVFWYHMMMILLTAGSSAVRPRPPKPPRTNPNPNPKPSVPSICQTFLPRAELTHSTFPLHFRRGTRCSARSRAA